MTGASVCHYQAARPLPPAKCETLQRQDADVARLFFFFCNQFFLGDSLVRNVGFDCRQHGNISVQLSDGYYVLHVICNKYIHTYMHISNVFHMIEQNMNMIEQNDGIYF